MLAHLFKFFGEEVGAGLYEARVVAASCSIGAYEVFAEGADGAAPFVEGGEDDDRCGVSAPISSVASCARIWSRAAWERWIV